VAGAVVREPRADETGGAGDQVIVGFANREALRFLFDSVNRIIGFRHSATV
jgi:hypothetical protein